MFACGKTKRPTVPKVFGSLRPGQVYNNLTKEFYYLLNIYGRYISYL